MTRRTSSNEGLRIPGQDLSISFSDDMWLFLMNQTVDSGAMGELLEGEGLDKDSLGDLWVHLSTSPFWVKLQSLPSAGAFIPSALLNSSEGTVYRDLLREEVNGVLEDDLYTKSFILIDVPTTLTLHRAHNPDRVEILGETLLHELLHYAEYIRGGQVNVWDGEQTLGKYARYDLNRVEEKRIEARELELVRTGVFRHIIRGFIPGTAKVR